MKLLLVCTQGGHFATMMGLKKFWSEHEREWVTHRSADTDMIAKQEKIHFVPRQTSRSIFMTCVNFFLAFPILFRMKPDLIISTGAAVAVPFIYAGRILGIKTIFIDSISRVENLSLTGKLIHPVVSEIYVQWEQCGREYRKVQYKGSIF